MIISILELENVLVISTVHQAGIPGSFSEYFCVCKYLIQYLFNINNFTGGNFSKITLFSNEHSRNRWEFYNDILKINLIIRRKVGMPMCNNSTKYNNYSYL